MASTARRILIASNSRDSPTINSVVERLREKGFGVVLYEADRVARGEKHLAVHVGRKGTHVIYDGNEIHDNTIAAAWLRRPSTTGPIPKKEDHAQRLWRDREQASTQDDIWGLISDKKWLNAPASIRHAERKLLQLAAARSLGFVIPETVVTNSRESITQVLPSGDRILKMHNAMIPVQGGYKAHYATIAPSDPDGKPQGFPFPGIWQNYIQKAKEWRVTIVGSEVFAAAVYTDADAKDDWRRYQATSKVTFKLEAFPDDLKARCFELLKYYGLRYGAFDFIECPDGTFVFMELNPNGQYYWLEHELGLPISDAVTSALIRIARQYG